VTKAPSAGAPTRPQTAEAPPDSTARFAAAIALGLLFVAAVNVAVRHAELVTGRYVAGGVPPIAAFGALLVLLCLRVPLRRLDLAFPLGFILATAYGDATPFVFPLFVAWLIKWLLLRVGGLTLYRAGIPFFIGLTLGHFTLAGILWPLISLLIGPEASAGYHLYFG
jgi:hypothetical protein